MNETLTLIAVVLMLAGAFLLIADVGAPGFWIATITVGIALVAIVAFRNRQRGHHA
ncbi:membrane-bound ClpP family serine protease [Nocardioides ginsengisegetis]|uniref:Membrane-bound ClpP family serine protease n=1 Tax=Nocardioides ginsengisegetis TaxID=661491 RepID=A0A7W3IWX7_9ACTN|nr:hypothetical protein [Nocardioides ginsengisegetis]MBA8802161.1 membrane-bound ClpP family serine protease [Nocardioides ginsengisegetis]